MTKKHRIVKSYRTQRVSPVGMVGSKETKVNNGWTCKDCGENRHKKSDFNDFPCEQQNYIVVD